MALERTDESIWHSEGTPLHTGQKARRGLRGEQRSWVPEELWQWDELARLWPCREGRYTSSFAIVPSCSRPRLACTKARVKTAVVYARAQETPPDPLGHVHAYGVTNELPALIATNDSFCRFGPAIREALHSLGVSDVRGDDPAVRHQNGRRRRNAESRTSFQRRNRVNGSAEATISLGPVEPESMARPPL